MFTFAHFASLVLIPADAGLTSNRHQKQTNKKKSEGGRRVPKEIMSSTASDKAHLVPLLEFLQFVSKKGKEGKARFPRKINGADDRIADGTDIIFEQDWPPVSPGLDCVFRRSESLDDSTQLSQDSSVGFTSVMDRRKRQRSPDSSTEATFNSMPSRDDFGDAEKSRETGSFATRSFAFSLGDLGLELLVDINRQAVGREVAARIQGMRCCYLFMGTSMIVTGDVADVNLSGKTVLVSPDSELRVEMEWVSLSRVYVEPEDVELVREEATRRIESIMEAEMEGKRPPKA